VSATVSSTRPPRSPLRSRPFAPSGPSALRAVDPLAHGLGTVARERAFHQRAHGSSVGGCVSSCAMPPSALSFRKLNWRVVCSQIGSIKEGHVDLEVPVSRVPWPVFRVERTDDGIGEEILSVRGRPGAPLGDRKQPSANPSGPHERNHECGRRRVVVDPVGGGPHQRCDPDRTVVLPGLHTTADL
jgi:hypothetical protein